jgi:hypothetical protein
MHASLITDHGLGVAMGLSFAQACDRLVHALMRELAERSGRNFGAGTSMGIRGRIARRAGGAWVR